jgi:hypothetical protein
VEFSDDSHAQRKFLEECDSVFQSHHVVPDFAQILRAAIHRGTGFSRQQFAECRLRSFNFVHGVVNPSFPNDSEFGQIFRFPIER